MRKHSAPKFASLMIEHFLFYVRSRIHNFRPITTRDREPIRNAERNNTDSTLLHTYSSYTFPYTRKTSPQQRIYVCFAFISMSGKYSQRHNSKPEHRSAHNLICLLVYRGFFFLRCVNLLFFKRLLILFVYLVFL